MTSKTKITENIKIAKPRITGSLSCWNKNDGERVLTKPRITGSLTVAAETRMTENEC